MAGRPKVIADQKIVRLGPELAKAVEDYRFEHRFGTEAEALRRLIRLGLEAEGRKVPEEKAA